MKQIFRTFIYFCLFLYLSALAFAHAQAESEMKMEGRCNGTMASGTQVTFTYYSDFNGCQQNINAAIKFGPDFGSRYYKGKRAFENSQDIYTVDTYRVTFKDSTGNLGGIYSYLDVAGQRQSIPVECSILDYEYDECPI